MPTMISQRTQILSGQIVEITGEAEFAPWGASACVGYLVYDSDDLNGEPVSLLNAGTVRIYSGADWVVGVQTGDGRFTDAVFNNQAGATFQVTASAAFSTAYGLCAPGPLFGAALFSPDLVNNGLFEVTSEYDAYGVSTYDPSFNFSNGGTIRVQAGGVAVGVELSSLGTGTGSFLNTGMLDVNGAEFAVGVYYGAMPTSFENSGTLRASSKSGLSVAVYIDAPVGAATFVNSGLIEGDFAFYVDPSGWVPTPETHETITNTGIIRGDIVLGLGADTIRNAGAITGIIDFGAGNDYYTGADGTLNGAVLAGENEDTLTGGRAADMLFGEAGNDRISGGGGDDFIEGGRDSDKLDGGEGFDVLSYASSSTRVVADLAAGTADSAGWDRISGFEHVIGSRFDDSITGSAADERLEGRQGADVLTGGGGADTFVFSAGDGQDVVTDFRANGDADRLEIYGYTAYAELRQVGADTLVVLSETDTILLRNVQASSVTADQLLFHAGPRAPVPQLDSTVPDVLTSDFIVYAGETIANQGFRLNQLMGNTAPSVFVEGTVLIDAPRVTNDYGVGVVTGFSHGDGRGGLGYPPLLQPMMFANSAIYNTASGVVEVLASGPHSAVGYDCNLFAVDFYNAGEFRVTSAGANATGVSILLDQYFQFTNTGLFQVEAAGSASGLVMSHGGTGFNTGEMLVAGGSNARGIWMGAPYHNAFVNTGTLQVTVAAEGVDSVGVSFSSYVPDDRPVLFNAGLIEADIAVLEVNDGSSGAETFSSVINTGELRGRVVFDIGRDELYNSGLITGHITLGSGDDFYDGRSGTQLGGVDGGDGNDMLLAGAGADVLTGGAGGDFLSGGAGTDVLTGGAGNDLFHFQTGGGADVITDFVAGGNEDAIEVAGYAGYLELRQVGADTLVVLSATDSILLRNVQVSALTSADLRFSAAPISNATQVGSAPVAPPAPSEPANTPEAQASLFEVDGTAAGDAMSGHDGFDFLVGFGGADTLDGRGGDDRLEGGAQRDVLIGGDGNDRLNGGTGADDLSGGAGADVYFVDDAGDVIHEAAGGGIDTVYALGVAWTLGDNVENLVVQGWMNSYGWSYGLGVGNALDNRLVSGDGQDRLEGREGNDTLVGGGPVDKNGVYYGPGDTLVGGLGDDTYEVRLGYDMVVELAGEGVDTVRLIGNGASGFYYLPANVENLVGGGAVVGNGLNNVLTGSDGLDNLDGGAGADRLVGGRSGDFYHVDDAGDVVVELVGEGRDGVEATVSFTLPDNVEDLNLAGFAYRGTGNWQNNQIEGNYEANRLEGLGGDDYLAGNYGDDILIGGTGADWLFGGAGADAMDGGQGDDIYLVDNLGDTVVEAAGGGVDLVKSDVDFTLPAWVENLQLGLSPKVGNGNSLDNTIKSSFYGARVEGRDGNDTLLGSWSKDTLLGGTGNDVLNGDEGDDVLDGGTGADRLDGGAGIDQASYANASGAVRINLTSGVHTGEANGDVFVSIERFGLSRFGDQFTGSAAADEAFGDLGNDTLFGATGNDVLDGGAGNDILRGGLGADRLIGGDGTDQANYQVATAAVTLNLTTGVHTGEAAGDTFESIERFVLSGYGDQFTGSAGADEAVGYYGNDVLFGAAGADKLDGGNGNDILRGGEGADQLIGGTGTDTASYQVATAAVGLNLTTGVHTGEAAGDTFDGIERFALSTLNDSFVGSAGADWVDGWKGNDVLDGQGGADEMFGNEGNDELHGGTGNDKLHGDGGADVLYGDAGADVLYGGTGADQLFGGDDGDFLWGEAGNDTLTGGAGADRFAFSTGSGVDVITDFVRGQDKIILKGMAGIDDFSDVRISADSHGWAVITWGDGTSTVTLSGIAAAQVTSSDIWFTG